MPIFVELCGAKGFAEIRNKRMAYFDVGEGDAIIFQHGDLSP